MKFDELHALVPYQHEGDLHSQTMQIYPEVRVKYPGRHALDTDPIGGDFVVEVNCANAQWDWKQFTHADIFKDIEIKTDYDEEFMRRAGIVDIAQIVRDNEAPRTRPPLPAYGIPGLAYVTLLQASQTLAVAEHRRYHRFEKNGGGRFLPLRFATGIVYGFWTAADAIKVQRRGAHGLRELQKEFGNPPTVKAIIDGTAKVS